MLDTILYFVVKYSFVITAMLFLVKFLLFLRYKNKNWTIIEFFYFNSVNIKFTAKAERARLKRLQNSLSVAILLLLIFQLFSALLL